MKRYWYYLRLQASTILWDAPRYFLLVWRRHGWREMWRVWQLFRKEHRDR